MIQFLLNETPQAVENCSPNMTVLEWLRTKMRQTGTKEGCATGDCGACTLLVGEEHSDGQWHYKTMNSCLLLVGNAHGKHIITVEAVTRGMHLTPEELHPVQRAMVECHGSQCGFCTPGFIMSLLALYINHEQYPGQKAVIHALGGNLCRCTGYSPILKAAEKAYEYERSQEPWSAMAKAFKQTLNQQSTSNTPSLINGQSNFLLPQSLDQLLTLKANHPEAHIVAGATDLAIEIGQQLLSPKTMISVTQTPELTEVIETGSQFTIGAAAPYEKFVGQLCEHYPETAELFERLGSTQVRNGGTLGGSLGNASPIGDPAPMLIALGASIELQSLEGARTLNVEDFFIGYRETVLAENEVITKVIIPKRSANLTLACHKVTKRFEDDISTVCLAIAIEHKNHVITSVRLAMGGMAAVPKRASQMEQQLRGAKFEAQSFTTAGEYVSQDFQPLTDVRASEDYRLKVTRNLMQRVGLEFCQQIPTSLRIAHASL